MTEEHSTNKRAEEIMGKRDLKGGMPIDQPCELSYHCPVCIYDHIIDDGFVSGAFDERLKWSEYNGFLWCSVCNRDYPSPLCMVDPVRATEFFLDIVEDAKKKG